MDFSQDERKKKKKKITNRMVSRGGIYQIFPGCTTAIHSHTVIHLRFTIKIFSFGSSAYKVAGNALFPLVNLSGF